MKRYSKISRLASVFAGVAVMVGATASWSCSDDNEEIDNTVTVLDTPENAANTNVATDEASFKWDAVKGAYTYTAHLVLKQDGEIVKAAVIDAPLTKVTFLDLEPATDYFFRVNANDKFSEGKNSAYTQWVKITTSAVAPEAQKLATPANVAAVTDARELTSLTFTWDEVSNAVSYTYRLSSQGGGNFNGNITDADWTEEGGKIVYKITGLTQGIQYAFQVRANPESGSQGYASSDFSGDVAARTIGQLATPVVILDSDETTSVSLKFTWDAVENAAGYVYQYAEGAGSFSADIPITDAFVELTGLNGATEYSIKVKAVAASGSEDFIDSEYSEAVKGTTMSATATQLDKPVPVLSGSAGATAFTITWTAVTDADKYTYQLGETGPETETTETSVTFNELTAETAYKVRVKALPVDGSITHTASEYSDWLTVNTASLAPTITVNDVDGFNTALADIADGGIITLNPGEYNFIKQSTETLNYELLSIKIDKNISIVGAAGGAKPQIYAKSIEVSGDLDKVVFRNIEYSAEGIDVSTGVRNGTATESSYFIDIKSTVQNVTIEDCYIHEVASAILRANRTSNVGAVNVSIQDNLMYNIGGKDGGLITARDRSGGNTASWVIKNNTITGIGIYGFSANSAQRFICTPKDQSGFTAEIMNNTFYNCYSGGNNCIDNNSASGDSGTIKIENNIFAVFSGAKGPRIGNNAGCTFDNNCVSSGWSAGTIAGTNLLSEDPGFTDYTTGPVPANADFTPGNSNVITRRIGDTRWLP